MSITQHTQKVFITLLFFLTVFSANAQREAPKAAEIKSGSSSSASSSYNSKGTPAKIKDTYGIWTDFNLRTKSDANAFRSQVGSTLFEEIASNCNETSGWPGAIASYEERNKVRDQMLKYVCYQIGEVDDKWVLRVPASENSFLPYGIRPDHDIYFMVRKTDVDLTGSPTRPASSGSSYSSTPTKSYSSSVTAPKGPKAKVKDSFGMWTDFDLRTKADASQVKAKLGSALYEDVANYCNETSWPSGIASFTEREKVRSELKDYVCYQIGESDDKWILRVPASENTFQPYNMRPTRDIYFVVRKTDVDLSGTAINTLSTTSSTSSSPTTYDFEDLFGTTSTTSSSTSSKGTPAKINATGGMYSTFNMSNETQLRSTLGATLFDEVVTYCKEGMWPTAIKDLTGRDKVRSQMNDYKAYKIAELDGKYILRIPAAENKFMPYDMQPQHDIYFVINQSDVTLGKSSSGSTNNGPNSSSFLDKTLTSGSATNYTNVTGFEAQINALLEGLPTNFENLKGDKIPGKPGEIMPSEEWYAKVKLEGSEKTIIREQWLGNENTMQAYYPEYKTKSEALVKYRSLVDKIAKSKFGCCTLVQNDEIAYDNLINTAWLPFDLGGTMGPGYKNMILEASVSKTFAIDKDFKMEDRWFVSVAIYRQK